MKNKIKIFLMALLVFLLICTVALGVYSVFKFSISDFKSLPLYKQFTPTDLYRYYVTEAVVRILQSVLMILFCVVLLVFVIKSKCISTVFMSMYVDISEKYNATKKNIKQRKLEKMKAKIAKIESDE